MVHCDVFAHRRVRGFLYTRKAEREGNGRLLICRVLYSVQR